MVVVPDIVLYADLQLVKIIEFVEVEELSFEGSEEALHGGIVIAVALARHALCDRTVLKKAPVHCHLVLPALVRM